MDQIKIAFANYKNFIIYSIIGVSGVVLDLTTFFILNHFLNVNVQISNIISTSIGIINNFFWNAFFNFKTKDNLLGRFISFYMVGLVGLLVTSIILFLFVTMMKFDANVVKACSIIIVVILQYSLNKKISFKVKETASEGQIL